MRIHTKSKTFFTKNRFSKIKNIKEENQFLSKTSLKLLKMLFYCLCYLTGVETSKLVAAVNTTL